MVAGMIRIEKYRLTIHCNCKILYMKRKYQELEIDHTNIDINGENGSINPEFIELHNKNIGIIDHKIADGLIRLDNVCEQLLPLEFDSSSWMALEGEMAQICHQIGQDYKHRAILTIFLRRSLRRFDERKGKRAGTET